MHLTMKNVANSYFKEFRRHFYVEDTKFVELFIVFEKHLRRRRTEIDQLSARLNGGIEKFDYMRQLVSELKKNLQATMPVLAQTTIDVELLIKQLAEKVFNLRMSPLSPYFFSSL